MNRRALLVVIALIVRAFLGDAPAEAYYSPLLTTEMIGRADAIVLGTIAEVGSGDFVFSVERTMHGEAAGALRVHSFRDWTCASRWAPYRSGQRLILFLSRGDASDALWRILGAGDEGEMLVEGDDVYHQVWPDRRGRAKPHQVSDGRFHGAVAPLHDVLDALQGYRALYRLVTDERGWGNDVERIGTERETQVFSRRSDFHRFLVLQSAHFVELAKNR